MKTTTVILLVGGTAVAAYLLIGRNGIVAPARPAPSKPAGGSSDVISIASSLLSIGATVIPAIFQKNSLSGGNAQSSYPESSFSDVSGSGDVLFSDN